ncbi:MULTISPECIES: hypothetical protein [Flectobacillus]|jgi:hypothetical protein|uniref:Uncharacterized protein n=2 Tax=Flectobacillus TaxID=101 RepID=A0ABT6Z3P1_9BACT|nr:MULTISPECIES: hypothetical protein [Flectobacillus]MDI9864632.1 hypothetical protein [Flectobacillus longus]MDI9875742.1 hypothetical protein [Flectobacillus rivi]
MTLQQLFDSISQNPYLLLYYLLLVPAITFLIGLWQTNPVNGPSVLTRYSYMVLAYMIGIPGIFALTLDVYLFLFERQSIWQMNLIIQILPIVSMAITLMLIKWKIPFEAVPELGRLSGFMTILTALIGILWFVDRLRIYAITYIPFHYIVVGFIVLLLAIRYGWKKLF